MGALAGPELHGDGQAVEGNAGEQSKVDVGMTPSPDTKALAPRLGGAAAVRIHLHPQAHGAVEGLDRTKELAPARRRVLGQISPRPQRQAVGDADHARGAAELGDQHPTVGLVVMAGLDDLLGAMRKEPPRRVSSSEQKRGSESKRGKHSQTTAPSRATRAAVVPSPIRPRSSRAGYPSR